jgi:hypothetical protein
MVVRRIPSYTHLCTMILQCECRVVVTPSRLFSGSRMVLCPWPYHHGDRPWKRFEPCKDGYNWTCKQRGCKLKDGRKYADRFLTCLSAARSHTLHTSHSVAVRVDDETIWNHVPLLTEVSSAIPF